MTLTTQPVTIKGETRVVEFRDIWDTGERLDSIERVGAFAKGGKKWAHRITLWRRPDGSYRLSTSTTILNRSGYALVGWADEVISDRNVSRHNSAGEVPK